MLLIFFGICETTNKAYYLINLMVYSVSGMFYESFFVYYKTSILKHLID